MCVQEKEGWPAKLRDPLGAKLVSSWGGTSASGQRCWHPHSPGQAVFRYGEMRPKGLKGLSTCC